LRRWVFLAFLRRGTLHLLNRALHLLNRMLHLPNRTLLLRG
jgi:hypothetical protein